MLTKYIQAAMKRAKYEILEDGTHFGHTPRLQGVSANARTHEECREELREALESWLLFGLEEHLPIPTLDGIRLTSKKVA